MDVFPSPQTPYETKGPLRRRELKYVIPGLEETMTNIVKTHLRLMVEEQKQQPKINGGGWQNR